MAVKKKTYNEVTMGGGGAISIPTPGSGSGTDNDFVVKNKKKNGKA